MSKCFSKLFKSGNSKIRLKGLTLLSYILESFINLENQESISILAPITNSNALDILSKREFVNKLKSLNKLYDFTFICAESSDADSLLLATQHLESYHLAIVKNKYTKAQILSQVNNLAPIQGLLYE